MANYKLLVPSIMKWEGGFSNHPADKGGATMKGVTLATFREWYGKDKTEEDLKKITQEQWGKIFKKGYWDKLGADEINSQSVANILVDWAWMSGYKTVIKYLQKNILKVTADGIVGPVTLKKINSYKPESLFNIIQSYRESFFRNIVKNNPVQKVFLKGWLNRLYSYEFNDK